MSKLTGARLCGTTDLRQREDNDFYATPAETTKTILEEIQLKGSILEPSCGVGHISKVLKEYYPNSEIISTDLIDRGYGKGDIEFLSYDFGRKFDNIITNPPFDIINKYIPRALELTTSKVVLLCKIQLLEGMKRKKMLQNTPLKYVYVFSKRQNILRGVKDTDEQGKKWNGTMCFCWYIWEHGYTGEPVIRWL